VRTASLRHRHCHVARALGCRHRGGCFLKETKEISETHDCQSIVGFSIFTNVEDFAGIYEKK
jgi:hypothetical protein